MCTTSGRGDAPVRKRQKQRKGSTSVKTMNRSWCIYLIPSFSYPTPIQTFQTSLPVLRFHHYRPSHLTDDGAHALVLAQPCTRPRRDLLPPQHGLPLLPEEEASCLAVGGRLLRRRKHEDRFGKPIQQPRRPGDRRYREGRGQQRDQATVNRRQHNIHELAFSTGRETVHTPIGVQVRMKATLTPFTICPE
jgi:hypothetical protein